MTSAVPRKPRVPQDLDFRGQMQSNQVRHSVYSVSVSWGEVVLSEPMQRALTISS